jgi:thioredoxin-related protein
MRIYWWINIITTLFAGHAAYAQVTSVPFEQLDSLQSVEQRPAIVFMHTSWCKFCALMKNTTLKNKDVVQALNTTFHFISFDAEEKKDILFLGQVFKYTPRGVNTGVHQLAEYFHTFAGTSAYPVLLFLSADNKIAFQIEGYIGPKELMEILKKRN